MVVHSWSIWWSYWCSTSWDISESEVHLMGGRRFGPRWWRRRRGGLWCGKGFMRSEVLPELVEIARIDPLPCVSRALFFMIYIGLKCPCLRPHCFWTAVHRTSSSIVSHGLANQCCSRVLGSLLTALFVVNVCQPTTLCKRLPTKYDIAMILRFIWSDDCCNGARVQRRERQLIAALCSVTVTRSILESTNTNLK